MATWCADHDGAFKVASERQLVHLDANHASCSVVHGGSSTCQHSQHSVGIHSKQRTISSVLLGLVCFEGDGGGDGLLQMAKTVIRMGTFAFSMGSVPSIVHTPGARSTRAVLTSICGGGFEAASVILAPTSDTGICSASSTATVMTVCSSRSYLGGIISRTYHTQLQLIPLAHRAAESSFSRLLISS